MPPYTESERGTSPMPSADEEIRAAKYVGTKRPVFLSSGEEEAPKPKKTAQAVGLDPNSLSPPMNGLGIHSGII